MDKQTSGNDSSEDFYSDSDGESTPPAGSRSSSMGSLLQISSKDELVQELMYKYLPNPSLEPPQNESRGEFPNDTLAAKDLHNGSTSELGGGDVCPEDVNSPDHTNQNDDEYDDEGGTDGSSTHDKSAVFYKDVALGPEITWDFSIKTTQNVCNAQSLWIEGPIYQQLRGECYHEMTHVTCDCEERKRSSICRLCRVVFCSSKCFKTKMQVQTGELEQKPTPTSSEINEGSSETSEECVTVTEEESTGVKDAAIIPTPTIKTEVAITPKSTPTEREVAITPTPTPAKKEIAITPKSALTKNDAITPIVASHKTRTEELKPQREKVQKKMNSNANNTTSDAKRYGRGMGMNPNARWDNPMNPLTLASPDMKVFGILGSRPGLPPQPYLQQSPRFNVPQLNTTSLLGSYPGPGINQLNNFTNEGMNQILRRNFQKPSEFQDDRNGKVARNPYPRHLELMASQANTAPPLIPNLTRKGENNGKLVQKEESNRVETVFSKASNGTESDSPNRGNNVAQTQTRCPPPQHQHNQYAENTDEGRYQNFNRRGENYPRGSNPGNQNKNGLREGYNRKREDQQGQYENGQQHQREPNKNDFNQRSENPNKRESYQKTGINNQPEFNPVNRKDFKDKTSDHFPKKEIKTNHTFNSNSTNLKKHVQFVEGQDGIGQHLDDSMKTSYGKRRNKSGEEFTKKDQSKGNQPQVTSAPSLKNAGYQLSLKLQQQEKAGSVENAGVAHKDSSQNRRMNNFREPQSRNDNPHQKVLNSESSAHNKSGSSSNNLSKPFTFNDPTTWNKNNEPTPNRKTGLGKSSGKATSNRPLHDIPFGVLMKVKRIGGSDLMDISVMPPQWSEEFKIRQNALQKGKIMKMDFLQEKELCMVMHRVSEHESEEWYRGIVINVAEKVQIYLLDLGIVTTVDLDAVHELPDEFRQQKPLAIRMRCLNYKVDPQADPATAQTKFDQHLTETQTIKVRLTHLHTQEPYLFVGYLYVFYANRWMDIVFLMKTCLLGDIASAEEIQEMEKRGILKSKATHETEPMMDAKNLVKAKLLHVESMLEFYITQDTLNERISIDRKINAPEFIKTAKIPVLLEDLARPFFMTLDVNSQKWVRVKVLEITSDQNEGKTGTLVVVKKCDYPGNLDLTVAINDLRELPENLHSLTSWVYKCSLPVKRPVRGQNEKFKMSNETLKELQNQSVNVKILDVIEDTALHTVEIFLENTTTGFTLSLHKQNLVSLTSKVDPNQLALGNC